MNGRKHWVVASLLGVAAIGMAACESGPTSAVAPSAVRIGTASAGARAGVDQQALAAIRRATARFQNIDAALAAGYEDDGFGCIDATAFGLDASEGAMGFHLINWALHDDPETDPERPDLLVYEPAPNGHGKPKLVALEYEVFRPDWYGAGHTAPPTLLGREFESFDFDGLEIFGLHLWLWRDNPSGLFADFNPKVRCR
jgi:hypothetical protein